MNVLEANSTHCKYCFDVLLSKITQTPKPLPQFVHENIECPLFVTWKKRRGNQFELRGCIGTFSSQPLADGLSNFALSSALQDPRFPPIESHEVPTLQCGVSLLKNFEEVDDRYDWEMGAHGVWLHFRANNQRMSATYLPHFTGEFDSKDQVLKSLVKKAGYSGRVDDSIVETMAVTRYQASVATLFHDDYVNL